MLQRLIYNSIELKLSGRQHLLFSIPNKAHLCHQCGSRLNSRYKVPDLFNYYKKSFYNRNGLFNLKLRCYSTQVDSPKTKEQILDPITEKKTLNSSKKINVKLKTSELKRLFDLAKPEKWTLTGKYTALCQLVLFTFIFTLICKYFAFRCYWISHCIIKCDYGYTIFFRSSFRYYIQQYYRLGHS